ncbi:MAG: DUF4013 domain-containing protein [Sandaracinaceae bacterium]|jgi:hypothetical protein|nr:DUF4013 domain-containing protein [Sandaracinaceae bacterium]
MTVPSATDRPTRTVDLTYAFELLQRDPEWMPKLGIYLLIWVIPILGWLVVMGWLSYAARRAVARLTPVFPPPTADLTTLLDYAEQGLKAFVTSLVWSLPAMALTLAVVGCLYFALIASVMSAAFGADSTNGLSFVMIPVFICGGVVVMAMLAVLNALLSLPAAAATLRAELSGQLGRGFDFQQVMAMVRLVLRDWVLNLVLLALATVVTVLFANALPILGIFVATFVIALTRVFAVVSVYEKYLAAGGEPVPLGPMEPRTSTPAR